MARKRQRLAAAMIILLLKKKKRSTWVRDWILKRREAGAFYNLLNELNIEDAQQYFNFTRMTAIDLEVLILKVGPIIKKQDTRFRESISPKERLLLTLRFLASGMYI